MYRQVTRICGQKAYEWVLLPFDVGRLSATMSLQLNEVVGKIMCVLKCDNHVHDLNILTVKIYKFSIDCCKTKTRATVILTQSQKGVDSPVLGFLLLKILKILR